MNRICILNRTLIKLGGSLLSLPDLVDRLIAIPGCLTTDAAILVGGGAAADLVRQWAESFCLEDEFSHQLAIEGMRLNAQLVASLTDRFAFAKSMAEADHAVSRNRVPVLDPVALICEVEQRLPPALKLPASWDTTSDSIAAWLAEHCGFERLLLIKSVDLPVSDLHCSIARSLARDGLVDALFPQTSQRVKRLDWCNLRHDRTVSVTKVW